MSVSQETPVASSVANGVTTVFPYAFTVLQADDLQVVGEAAGVPIAYTLGVHYTLAGIGTGAGSVTFLAPPANGTILTFFRDTELKRTTDYQSNGDLLARTVNADVDRLWLAMQELLAGGKANPSAVRVPLGETVSALPSAGQRLDKLLAFDLVTGKPELSTFTQTQLASLVAAAYAGGAGPLDALTFLQTGIGAVARTAQDKARESLSVADYKLAVEVGWDNAFARAIAHVVALATSANRTYGLPAIEIPGADYVFTIGNIQTFPWITLVAKGSVLLDFSNIPVGNHGFICNNLTALPTDTLKQPGNNAPWLDGSSGAIAVLGPGKGVSTGSAFRLGNFIAGTQDFRDASMVNVVATGWGVAQDYGSFNTYLCRTEGCRFETNGIDIKFNGVNTNSGERMVFEDCVFAGSNTALSHNGDSYDLHFVNCSFDFNTALIVFGAGANYCQINLESCYIEAFDGYIVDGNALVNTADINQVVVRIDSLTVLPRSATGSQSINSPSRTLFRGAFSLLLDDIKQRTERRPYIEDGAMIDASVKVVRAAGYHTPPYSGPLRLDAFVNRDYDFQLDASGTVFPLAAWEIDSAVSVASDLFTTGGKKVARFVGTSGANTSAVIVRGKQSVPCRAGDVFWTSLCLNANLATGNVGTQAWVQFYDDADTSLGFLPAFARYLFRDALNDATVPNFAVGNDRWMDTSAFRCVAPKNAASAKMLWAVDTFDGTVYVSRARMWRDR